MATMRDVAARAGVSAKTVSRVFNHDPHVTAQTRQRVETALRELNYVANSIPTTLRNGRAPLIGVALPDIVDPFFAQVARAAELHAARQGMSVIIASLDSADREPDVVQGMLRQALTGLIITPAGADHGYLRAWVDRIPVVFVDRPPVGVVADTFLEDDLRGAHLATTHLVEHGHTRIAFIGDTLTIPTTRSRLAGYRAALDDAGIAVDDGLIELGATDRSGAAAAFAALERLDRRPTALFCTNSRAAIGLIPALRSSGLAVTTFGDFPLADMLTPALTVVDQDPLRLGQLAAQRVSDRLAHPQRRYQRRTVLPVTLVERESCRVTDRLPPAG